MSRKDRCAFWYTGLRLLTHRTRDETDTETTICRRHCARIKESNCAWEERDIDFEQPLRDRECHKPRSPDREYGSLCLKNASCLGWSKCLYSCCSYAAISRSNALLSLIFRSRSFLSRVRSAPLVNLSFFGALLYGSLPLYASSLWTLQARTFASCL